MFLEPVAVKCPRCAADSQHNSKDLLSLVPMCPECGIKLDEVGMRIGAKLDEASAFGLWAEVLIGVEERLKIDYPGIPDGEIFSSKPLPELTLRDMVRLVDGFLQPGVETNETTSRLVLEVAQRWQGSRCQHPIWIAHSCKRCTSRTGQRNIA